MTITVDTIAIDARDALAELAAERLFFTHDLTNPALNRPIDLDRRGAADERVTGTNATEVTLVGGPGAIPRRLLVSDALAAGEKLKICHLGGYEHFERGVAGPTFTWTMRTKIA